jgi:Multicopper oxidase
MKRRAPRLGLIAVAVAGFALTVGGAASAIAPNAPKLGIVCTNGSLSSGVRTFNLVAKAGDIQTPDGNDVFMWSYANADAPDNGAFQSPGPVLCANQGETVHVNLTNQLTVNNAPAPDDTSIVFPGQDGALTTTGSPGGALTAEAAANGGTASYEFQATNAGTYLYESGTDPAKQVEMGLYGALVVYPSAAHHDQAYGSTTAFDTSREYVLLLAEIDPVLHHAVETGGAYDFNTLHNRYYTINGRSFPDTVQDNGSNLLPNQPYGALVRIKPNGSPGSPPALVRMLNAGVDNHPFHPHGNHTTEIAQDGRLILTPGGASASTERFAETIGAGQTRDYLLRWDDIDNWDPVSNPLPQGQPNYRELTFKDGNTYYSGSPYLGYKGTLPVGTVTHNVCGEWYFPLHSHALNEFTNFDEGFGGMGTLLRVDPPAGCSSAPGSSSLVGAVLKSGTVSALAVDDTTYYEVTPKTTTKSGNMSSGATSMSVASASGFPSTNGYYVRVANEVMRVTGGAGTTTWTVARGQLGTSAASHNGTVTVSALATDWYAGFSGVIAGSQNLTVTYKGRNCANISGTSCTAIAAPIPTQTTKICRWTVAGAAGCSTADSSGWVQLPAPQTIAVGSTDVSTTWSTSALPGAPAGYIGTGANKGQVRVLVHTQRWTASNPTPFSTWGNFMQVAYDAP